MGLSAAVVTSRRSSVTACRATSASDARTSPLAARSAAWASSWARPASSMEMRLRCRSASMSRGNGRSSGESAARRCSSATEVSERRRRRSDRSTAVHVASSASASSAGREYVIRLSIASPASDRGRRTRGASIIRSALDAQESRAGAGPQESLRIVHGNADTGARALLFRFLTHELCDRLPQVATRVPHLPEYVPPAAHVHVPFRRLHPVRDAIIHLVPTLLQRATFDLRQQRV